jgi:hypothetical protein
MEEKAITTTNQSAPAPASLFDFGTNLGKAWNFADTLSKSQIVPDTFKGNTASCLIALDMANRMRRNPLEVMQALYIVHGKPSFSSSFLISLINSCGYYEPLRFRFEGEGDKHSCTAWTVDRRTGESIEGPTISIQMAKDEGWYGKAGSKWKTMPDVMLRYRAASFFSRAYCPDLTGGFHSVEEARDDNGEQYTKSAGMAKSLEAELKAQANTQNAAPIDADMLDLGPRPEPEPAAPRPSGSAPVTEVEKLRFALLDAFDGNFTADESDAWISKNFGDKKTLKDLTKDDLKAAISRLNAELDAKALEI